MDSARVPMMFVSHDHNKKIGHHHHIMTIHCHYYFCIAISIITSATRQAKGAA
jgi:hypothetical protein